MTDFVYDKKSYAKGRTNSSRHGSNIEDPAISPGDVTDHSYKSVKRAGNIVNLAVMKNSIKSADQANNIIDIDQRITRLVNSFFIYM